MDLFTDTATPEHLDMPGADVSLVAGLSLPDDDRTLLKRLIAETAWRQESISIYGRTVPQPRLVAWYGEPGQAYSYSGIRLAPEPWTPLLLELKDVAEAAAGEVFNSVLLNYYRNGADSIGMHSDDEPELGREPIIASLSLGEARTFLFEHRRQRNLERVSLPLPSGSLLIMRGPTQANWKHGIRKSRRPCGPRINLTFRKIEAK